MKILVVDDSRLARASVIKTLKETFGEENEILQASNGQEALDTYKSTSIDIVFLDLTMPIMDGFEALRQIKAYDAQAHIVIVSADIQEKAVNKVMSDGALMHVQKPINATKMQEIIKTVDFLSKLELPHA